MYEQSATSQANGAAQFEPESPFLSDAPAPPVQSAPRYNRAPASASAFPDTPFVTETVVDGRVGPGPEAELFAHLMAEFRDAEFGEAITQITHEAGAIAEARGTYSINDPARRRADAERAVRDYLAPLARDAEATVENIASELESRDVAALAESELEALSDGQVPPGPYASPSFENFLKKLAKKVKKVVKAVAKVARKVLPVDAVLGKLKAMVRPLLERVLRTALDKLPPAVQPAAVTVAKRLLGIDVRPPPAAEPPGDGGEPAPAAADPGDVQEEADAALAGYAVRGEAFERELELAELAAAQAQPEPDTLAELDRARARFAAEIVAMKPGDDPTPALENFLPAVLAAARIAIKIIGREKVVGFLAKQIALLIGRFVGADAATALSRSLVDAGLKLVSLETTEEAERLFAGYTLASTVEGTVRQLAAAPAAVWENEALFEARLRDAFERAAAADFPDPMIRGELREASEASGAWVLMPPDPAKLYKKYTNVIETQLKPKDADVIRTFGGATLAEALRDQQRVRLQGPTPVRIHLYEAIDGTWLSRIAAHERGVRGLGHAGPSAWMNIHPLTRQAATALLGEAKLGTDVSPTFLRDRNRIKTGQRFYVIEFKDASASAPVARPSRSSHVGLTLNLVGGEIRFVIFYGEADAQKLAGLLKSGAAPAVILQALTAGLDVRLRLLLAEPNPNLHVVHEATPFERFGPLAPWLTQAVRGWLVERLLDWVLKVISTEVQKAYAKFADSFQRAADADADGVSIVIAFRRPPLLETLRRLATGSLNPMGVLSGLVGGFGEFSFDVVPGLPS